MKKFLNTKLVAFTFFMTATMNVFAQAPTTSTPFSANQLVITLFTVVIIMVVVLTAIMGNKIIRLVDEKTNGEGAEGFSLWSSMKQMIFGDNSTSSNSKKKTKRLNRGFDIKLRGKARKNLKSFSSATYAVKPSDFVGLRPIPKMMVKEGDAIKAGDKLFYDKGFEGVFFTSPVSGKVKEIKRGAKRAISEIIIESDGNFTSRQFDVLNATQNKETIINQLLESGAWTFFTERPFGVVANPKATPKAIFVSACDTAPYAADYGFILSQLSQKDLQAGIDILNVLTDKVYFNTHANQTNHSVVDQLNNVEVYEFKGQHPAGNVGVQIHHIDAINKGEVVWTIKAEDVATIGKLANEGVYQPTKFVAVNGDILKDTFYIKTTQGADLSNCFNNNLSNENARFISGNVLTGTQIEKDGYLGFADNTICAIEEGDHHELFGWMLPQYARPSISPTFPWKNFDLMSFEPNTNTHGEKRAFVVTGQYEEVLPMDVYPQLLMKSIVKNDFDEMEGLGIYELLEEDVALCEFACTSKQPLQHILREGLDYIRSQS